MDTSTHLKHTHHHAFKKSEIFPSEKKIQKRTKADTTIAVIGLGYVGLPLAILAERAGYTVVGFDIDNEKINSIKKKDVDFLAHNEHEDLAKSKMRVGTRDSILQNADIFIICVPTPVDETHIPDLDPLREASRMVGTHLKKDGLVIIESTVNPRVCRTIALPILEEASGLRGETDFGFAHCPERINPGDPQYGVNNIPRVMGALGPSSLRSALDIYRNILEAEVTPMTSLEEAEAVKMVENAFRDINIAFVNELAMSFGKAGIDITNVIHGASTKPFGFMAHLPGCGVGGHCIPVDPYYLIDFGKENGFVHRFLIAAREINSSMPFYTVRLLSESLAEKNIPLKESVVALLGLSYKKDISDMRESPALVIAKALREQGVVVKTFDPHVPRLSTEETLESALKGADAAIIATDHEQFRNLMPQDFLLNGVSVVIDGRNCLSKEAFITEGLTYRGIGR
jgi:UDP-N-acetyl-D-glucosamine dehydrogenase